MRFFVTFTILAICLVLIHTTKAGGKKNKYREQYENDIEEQNYSSKGQQTKQKYKNQYNKKNDVNEQKRLKEGNKLNKKQKPKIIEQTNEESDFTYETVDQKYSKAKDNKHKKKQRQEDYIYQSEVSDNSENVANVEVKSKKAYKRKEKYQQQENYEDVPKKQKYKNKKNIGYYEQSPQLQEVDVDSLNPEQEEEEVPNDHVLVQSRQSKGRQGVYDETQRQCNKKRYKYVEDTPYDEVDYCEMCRAKGVKKSFSSEEETGTYKQYRKGKHDNPAGYYKKQQHVSQNFEEYDQANEEYDVHQHDNRGKTWKKNKYAGDGKIKNRRKPMSNDESLSWEEDESNFDDFNNTEE